MRRLHHFEFFDSSVGCGYDTDNVRSALVASKCDELDRGWASAFFAAETGGRTRGWTSLTAERHKTDQ